MMMGGNPQKLRHQADALIDCRVLRGGLSGGMLVAEDNPDDLFFLRKAVLDAGLSGSTVFVEGGSQAIEFLETKMALGPSALPKVVLLDLVMPRVSGFDVLAWMNPQRALANVSVVVLTGIGDPQKLQHAVRCGAKRCYVKGVTAAQWVNIISELGREFGLYPVQAVTSRTKSEGRQKEI